MMRDARRGGWGALLPLPLPLTMPFMVIPQPALADVVARSENGFVVRVVAEVAAKPADAWKTMISPAQWWSSQHTFSGDAVNLTLEPVAGGCFCESLPRPEGVPATQKLGAVQHLRVVYVEPPRAMRLIGALGPLQSEALSGTMTMTIKPTPKGSRLLLEYVVGGYMRYKVEEIAPAVDRMLTAQIAGLAAKLGPVEELPVPAAKAGGGSAGPAKSITPQGPPQADEDLLPVVSGSKSVGPLSGIEDYRLPPLRSAAPASAPASAPAPTKSPHRSQTVRPVDIAPAGADLAAPHAVGSTPAGKPDGRPPAKPAIAAPAALKRQPKPTLSKPAAAPVGKVAPKPATKPAPKAAKPPKVPNPDNEAHRDANAAFDAALGAGPVP